jgi:hypothetical protein
MIQKFWEEGRVNFGIGLDLSGQTSNNPGHSIVAQLSKTLVWWGILGLAAGAKLHFNLTFALPSLITLCLP